jgi:CRISPR-associated protein Cmr2
VILDRREEKLETRFNAVLNWIGDWEKWAIDKQIEKQENDKKASKTSEPPIGTEVQDLSKLLRFTAFWVDKRVERLAWGKPADKAEQEAK